MTMPSSFTPLGRAGRSCVLAVLAAAPLPLAAQGRAPDQAAPEPAMPETTVFDGDYITVGGGLAYAPSYTGSDDYVAFPLPMVQGRVGGVSINPRPAGVALDFLPDPDTGPGFALGITGKMNRNRTGQIRDEVVEAYGELDTAVEIGPSVGVRFPGVLHPYDSLSISTDVVWDVAGAHKGMSVSPSITYFTPLSRGAAVALSMGTKWIDRDYADYYYSVPATNPGLPPADVLPGYSAGSGFESAGAALIGGVDLNGDLTDGGLAVFAIAGYSHLLGDARNSPFTSIRGSAGQFFGGIGLGYTF